jgi:hypothetical protein
MRSGIAVIMIRGLSMRFIDENGIRVEEMQNNRGCLQLGGSIGFGMRRGWEWCQDSWV